MTTKLQAAQAKAIADYRYNKRDEHVFDKGHAAYQIDGISAKNPYNAMSFPLSYGAFNCGLRAAHREAFDKRQQDFMNNHA